MRVAGAAIAALVAAGCSDPACKVDLDCAALERCAEGVCEPLDLRAAREGLCGADGDCAAGEVCRDGRCAARTFVAACTRALDPACGEGRLCGLDAAGCPDEGCRLPTACVEPVGALRGTLPCDDDASCASGACVGGTCLRVCTADADCAVGFVCTDLPRDDGKVARGCVGAGEGGAADPAITGCDRDADCRDGRRCAYADVDGLEGAVGRCVVADEGLLAVGERCGADAACASNFCYDTCTDDDHPYCRVQRCAAPCAAAADCPAPYDCSLSTVFDPVGEDGAPARFCRSRENDCWDDLHCCPEVAPDGTCVGGWEPTPTYCTPTPLGAKWHLACLAPEGKAITGEACSVAGDCASGLCVAARPEWSPPGNPGPPPAEGWRVCTSPCDPDDDRCDALRYALGTCSSYDVVLSTGTFEIHVCQ